MVCCPCVEDLSPCAHAARPSHRFERTLAPPSIELAPRPMPLLRPVGAFPRVRRSPEEQLCRRRLPPWIWNKNWGLRTRPMRFTMKRAGSSSSDRATWVFFLFLSLLQQFLLRWFFFPQFGLGCQSFFKFYLSTIYNYLDTIFDKIF